MMRSVRTLTTATLVAATVFGGLGSASLARATTKEEVAVNGTFRATSVGDYAQRNDQYFGEPTVYQTWTISSTCDTFQECHGTVSSDQGWSAPALCKSGMWTVTHDVPNWEPCPNGTAAVGQQKFAFRSQTDLAKFDGWDTTLGPSGACGVNQWLVVSMPFTLNKRE